MAFIGDDHVAAQRLAEVDLDRATASRAWRELLDEVALFIERELVSLGRYFARHDVDVDLDRALATVGADAHRVARQAVIGSRTR